MDILLYSGSKGLGLRAARAICVAVVNVFWFFFFGFFFFGGGGGGGDETVNSTLNSQYLSPLSSINTSY